MSAKYAIGIDLGTTNCCLAYVPLEGDAATVSILPIPQQVTADTTETLPLLPSFIFLGEKASTGKRLLRWIKGDRTHVVGEWARRQAADVPTRTVAGAKSWLCHSGVDRRKAILPWNAPADVSKISPVDASRFILEHLVSAWDNTFPEDPFAEQEIVLTVPASFDASACELTREAALKAGFPENFTLLEEPQAALYAWLADAPDTWRRSVREGDVILVCDVGGGTSDFTLISIGQENGDLSLQRRAVGNHILVGGDNMDLALAHQAQTLFNTQGVKVDGWQSVSLWHACRAAKETLLAPDAPTKCPVTILGRGHQVVGEAVSAELVRKQVLKTLMDGFFPDCAPDARPIRRASSGFRELGLPFESDPAVTHHLAHFLSRQEGLRPTRVLFNGGVFKSDVFQKRILDVLASWQPDGAAPTLLSATPDYDLAVARGAAYYTRARRQGGIRIRGGTARTYYLGIETAGPAIPGVDRPLNALCVVPRGMEEGSETHVPGDPVGLVVGEPARFRFFTSSTRNDTPGTLLSSWGDDDLVETAPVEAALPGTSVETFVPVHFLSKVTELGILELWCVNDTTGERWKLEYRVREES